MFITICILGLLAMVMGINSTIKSEWLDTLFWGIFLLSCVFHLLIYYYQY